MYDVNNNMLSRNFYDQLEYAITGVLAASTDKEINCLWCDGIIEPGYPATISQEYINQKREITLIAFIGKDGQDQYELILKLGRKSLSKYARKLDLTECIPAENNVPFSIDIRKKLITISLA